MKTISLFLSIFLLVAVVLVSSSCEVDKCKNTVCLNGGACKEGNCICPTGYTGTTCETKVCTNTCQNGGTVVTSTCSCNCPAGYSGASCETPNGNVTFWNNDASVGTITVYTNNTSGTISSNTSPSWCNASGCANFSRSPGTYSYTASATTGQTWSGYYTITAGGCITFHLYI
jgi:hypothetical protein